MEILARLLAGACLCSLSWRSVGDCHGMQWRGLWMAIHPDLEPICSPDGVLWYPLVLAEQRLGIKGWRGPLFGSG